ARQEAEPLARFHRRPRQDDAIDFLALEQRDRIGDREPGLAGAGRTDPEHELVALQRADIGILPAGARTHRALAQIDLLEGRPRRRGIEIEQRALRDGETNRALDVALGDVVSALDLLVQAFEHAPRTLDRIARALHHHLVAAGVRGHAEAPLDQRKILPVL